MKAQQSGEGYLNKGTDYGADTRGMDSVLDGVDAAAQDAKDSKIGKSLTDAAHKAGDLAASAKDTVSNAVGSVASSVAGAVETSAEKLEEGLQWGKKVLEHPTVDKASSEISSFVRRYPLQSFLGALAVGVWLGGKTTSHRS